MDMSHVPCGIFSTWQRKVTTGLPGMRQAYVHTVWIEKVIYQKNSVVWPTYQHLPNHQSVRLLASNQNDGIVDDYDNNDLVIVVFAASE